MKKLKVLEIIGDSTLAGAPRHLLSLLENFDTKKFTLLAICPPGPLAGEIRSLKKNVDLEIIQMNSKLDFSAIKHIRKYVRRLKPDIIHIHGTRAGSVGRLAVAGLNFPVIYTEHLWTKHYKMTSRIAHRIQLIGLWFLDMFTTTNIAVSQAVKDFMIENQISREEKIVVIYNGIEPAKHHAKIFTSKDYVLGTVGTLNPQKGIQFIIQAMPQILKEFPQTKLQIVGEGTYRKHLTKMVKKMHLIKSVHFSGFVKDVDEEIDKFDIYIQASLSESFGLAIIQAMNVSIPIVATNTGGIPEVVTSNKSGILVEAAKPDALANAILKLLRDPE
ncbi:MAG: group 1 glycosyl transferase, partial [Candidatus Berkelbacteria bacterium]|nr:group 1 glycosyl transferase [Candidatus Berkelbacteria bacterium]